MNTAIAGLAMLAGVVVATRRPWLGARYRARFRGRGQRRPRGMTTLGLAGWSDRAPSTKGERMAVQKKCGKRCFAGRNRSYPMCAKGTRVCATDCGGARAAFSRARQQHKPAIAKKAVQAGKRAGCKWVGGKAAQSVLKSAR